MRAKKLRRFWCELFGQHEWVMTNEVTHDERYKYIWARCRCCGMKGFRQIEKDRDVKMAKGVRDMNDYDGVRNL